MPRWDSEAKKMLKTRFLKFYQDESHCPNTPHPLLEERSWKQSVFEELFRPQGFTKDQWNRNYSKALKEFLIEMNLNERRKRALTGETDSTVSENEVNQSEEEATEEKKEKKPAQKKSNKKVIPSHPFMVPLYSEDVECLIPIAHWGADIQYQDTVKYKMRLPAGLNYDAVDVILASNMTEFHIECHHHSQWFTPEYMMSDDRLEGQDAKVWQCQFKETIKNVIDINMTKARIKVMTPFRVERIRQKESRDYRNKKAVKKLVQEIHHIESKIHQLELGCEHGDLNGLRSHLAGERYKLEDPASYTSLMEVTVTNLDQKM